MKKSAFISVFLILFILINQIFSYGQIITPPNAKLNPIVLENKSISDIWILKNSIYAKHGMPFTTYELHALFMKQKWYKPNKYYKSSSLSSIDTYNINLLSEKEKQLKILDYKVDLGLRVVNFQNIYNPFQFPNFGPLEKEKIQNNGFIVYPTDRNQLFHVYENNDYLGIPSFITVDAVLQLYHLYFDKTLRDIESNFLTEKLNILLKETINELIIQRSKTRNQRIIKSIDFNLAYLGVSQNLLEKNQVKIHGNLSYIALNELEKIKRASDYDSSKLLNRLLDYSQYIPRGHYTRSDELKRYFQSMMWLGNAGIDLKDSDSYNESNILSSLILTRILFTKENQGKALISYWNDIYELTAFYVGLSDDTGPREIKQTMDQLFSNTLNLEEFDDSEKLLKLAGNLKKGVITGKGAAAYKDLQFRIMGQRFIPDSYIFQKLTTQERPMPNGLEIMASFGSQKAHDLMLKDYKYTWYPSYPNYEDSLNDLVTEFKSKPVNYWKQSLYYHWLYNLKALFQANDTSNLPFFMTTNAWQIKNLNTSLASWSELRHNTILYAKQSEVVECGGDDGTPLNIWVPEPPKGYVEPNIELYNRLISLLTFTTSRLASLGMIDDDFKHSSDEFIDVLKFLKDVSEKQLKQEKISLGEYEQIQKFGSAIENLTLKLLSDEPSFSWNDVNGPDKNLPVIADVHRAQNEVLEVGVGKAHAIYAVVEIEGKLKLVRGAIFSYYEFPWNSSDRLTDEKWQNMLNNNQAPKQPKWINYKINDAPEKKIIPLYKPSRSEIEEWSKEPGWKLIYYDTGC